MTRPELERRALEAWRAKHSLVSRLVDAWASSPKRAMRLAAHVERWYGEQTPAGERWPYQWLMADVAHWPRIQEPKPEARVRVLERRRVRVECPTCQGRGSVLTFRDFDGVRRHPLLGYWGPAELYEECPQCEGAGHVFEVVDTPRAAMERLGYEVRTWRAKTGEFIAEAVVDGRQVVMVGGKDEDTALRYLAGELGVFLDEALTGADARGNGR